MGTPGMYCEIVIEFVLTNIFQIPVFMSYFVEHLDILLPLNPQLLGACPEAKKREA